MKPVLQLAVVLSIFLFEKTLVRAQGTFINLDFEQAQIVTIPGSPYFPHDVVRSSAIPGWTSYDHFLGPNTIWHNEASLGSQAVSIHDSAGYGPLMQGQYRMLLQPRAGGAFLAGIGQVGTLPLNVQSVQWYQSGDLPRVTFGGVSLTIFHLSDAAGYSIYGANLPGLAGAIGELQFRSQYPLFGVWLDNISFSTQAVPEPSSYALIALGLALAFIRRRPRG